VYFAQAQNFDLRSSSQQFWHQLDSTLTDDNLNDSGQPYSHQWGRTHIAHFFASTPYTHTQTVTPFYYTVSQKTAQLWNGIARNGKDRF